MGETAESVAEKARVENKERWGKEAKTTVIQSSSLPATLTSSGTGRSQESGQKEKKDEDKIEKEKDKVNGGKEENTQGDSGIEKDGKRKRESSSSRSKGERGKRVG